MRLDDLTLQPKWLSPQLPREGRYVMGPLLGKGGMGEVVEAWDVVLCRTVALKALREMEPAAMIRFMHEAQVQARVVHPNICRIYDIESSEATLMITMQLIKGPSLEQAAKQLSVDEVVAIMAQVTEAVHAAHRVNLIHRDIKPSNILLERLPDGPWVPYLCDFGLALSLGEPAMTMSRSVVGTPAFMAPEQTRGDRDHIAPATDVYALGGTLHYALLGYPPGLLAATPKPRRVPKPGLPRDLDTIISKCLEEDPEHRYPTAAALAEDLWRFRNGEPILARPRSRRWFRLPLSRPRQGRGLVATVLAAGALALAGWLGWKHYLLTQDEASAQASILDAEEAGFNFLAQEALPVHDLRPARALVRQHMAATRARMAKGGDLARAAGLFALAQCHLLLGEYEAARQAVVKARDLNPHEGDLDQVLARAKAGEVCWAPGLDGAGQGPDTPAPPGAAQETPQTGKEPELFQQALVHFLSKDYALAALDAQLAGEALNYPKEPAGLEAAALCAQGRQRFQAGDLVQAKAKYQQAREAAQKELAVWKSSETLHHALTRATLGLAEVAWEDGVDPQALLAELGAHSELALGLDPEAPDLMEDWLDTRFLVAKYQMRLGHNAAPGLEQAVAFLANKVKEPATPGLKAGRMLVYWQLAEYRRSRREDPGPALLEALRQAESTPMFNREYLGKVLNFKARLELDRNQDPRPTLDNNLERLQPMLAAQNGWTAPETAAEAWLIRAQWEARRSLDPGPSLAQLKGLTGQALRICPGAPAAHAIKDLALALEVKHDSGRMPTLEASTRRASSRQPAPAGHGASGRS